MNIHFRSLKIVAFLPLITLSSCAGPSAIDATGTARRASVCEVVARPQAYDGRTVLISAAVESDFTHVTILKDDRCKRRGLAIGTTPPANAVKSPEFDAGMEQLRTNGGTVSADFLGVVSLVKSDFPHAEINLISISKVRYRPKDTR